MVAPPLCGSPAYASTKNRYRPIEQSQLAKSVPLILSAVTGYDHVDYLCVGFVNLTWQPWNDANSILIQGTS